MPGREVICVSWVLVASLAGGCNRTLARLTDVEMLPGDGLGGDPTLSDWDWAGNLDESLTTVAHATAGAQLGWKVVAVGSTAVVSASEASAGVGAAFVYVQGSDRSWAFVSTVTTPSAQDDGVGAALSFDGTRLALSAPRLDSGGVTNCGGVFITTGAAGYDTGPAVVLSSPDYSDRVGLAVAVRGIYLAASPSNAGGGHDGQVMVWRYDGSLWSERPSLAALCQTGNSQGAGCGFGNALAFGSDTLVVGSYAASDAGDNAGAAYVFRTANGGASWALEAELVPPQRSRGAYFGMSAAVDGDVVVIGAPGDLAAYVFTRRGTAWPFSHALSPNDPDAVGFGRSIALNAEIAAVGAPQQGPAERGAVYLFDRAATGWPRLTKVMVSDAHNYDHFGSSVALTSDTLVVGAPDHDASGLDAGAVYFLLPPGR